VVDRDAATWSNQLEKVHAELFGPGKADPLAPVRLEVIDRATDETIQRLIAAGLITRTIRATRPLFPGGGTAESTPLSTEEQTKARAFRDRAARQLKMATVLGAGDFADEARQALLGTIHTLAGALAVEHRLPEPPALPDSLQAPLSHLWGEALPLLRAFTENPGSPWKPVADCLARV
jgi:hypothetical protein